MGARGHHRGQPFGRQDQAGQMPGDPFGRARRSVGVTLMRRDGADAVVQQAADHRVDRLSARAAAKDSAMRCRSTGAAIAATSSSVGA